MNDCPDCKNGMRDNVQLDGSKKHGLCLACGGTSKADRTFKFRIGLDEIHPGALSGGDWKTHHTQEADDVDPAACVWHVAWKGREKSGSWWTYSAEHAGKAYPAVAVIFDDVSSLADEDEARAAHVKILEFARAKA
jgi:hypothetical protein